MAFGSNLDIQYRAAAASVTDARATGWEAPPSLTAAVELHDGIGNLEPPMAPDVILPTTVDEAVRLLREGAEATAFRIPWAERHADMLGVAEQQVIREVRAVNASLTQHFAGLFDQTAAAFTDAASHLPRRITRERLSTVDAATHTYFEQATELHKTIRAMRDHLDWLAGGKTRPQQAATRYTLAESDADLEKATAIFAGNRGLATATALDPWHGLVEEGIAIGWRPNAVQAVAA